MAGEPTTEWNGLPTPRLVSLPGSAPASRVARMALSRHRRPAGRFLVSEFPARGPSRLPLGFGQRQFANLRQWIDRCSSGHADTSSMRPMATLRPPAATRKGVVYSVFVRRSGADATSDRPPYANANEREEPIQFDPHRPSRMRRPREPDSARCLAVGGRWDPGGNCRPLIRTKAERAAGGTRGRPPTAQSGLLAARLASFFRVRP